MIQALVVEVAAAGVVVDDVEHDGDPVEVEHVDEGLELIDVTGQLTLGQGRESMRGQPTVDPHEIVRQFTVLDAVVGLGREDVRAVVPLTRRRPEFHDGQRLHRPDAEVGEVFDPVEDVEQLRDPVRTAVVSLTVDRREDTDVELIDRQVGKIRRPESGVVPRVLVEGADDAHVLRRAPPSSRAHGSRLKPDDPSPTTQNRYVAPLVTPDAKPTQCPLAGSRTSSSAGSGW